MEFIQREERNQRRSTQGSQMVLNHKLRCYLAEEKLKTFVTPLVISLGAVLTEEEETRNVEKRKEAKLEDEHFELLYILLLCRSVVFCYLFLHVRV